ncbi:MAG: histidine phosphatase family protein [Planctomycetia bacterium]|nr:histidine phosphatase family protein [Planctomycetia bacterium]
MADFLVVIRSGPTDYDLQGRIRGTLDVPLAAQGVAEAEAAAAAVAPLAPVVIYASPDASALETARHVARACGQRVRRLDGLANLDQGLWQGMLVDEIRLKQPRLYRQWQDNPWAVSPPEGELLEEACGRVEAALERLCRRQPAGRIVLVVPAPLDRIVRWITSGDPLGDLWSREPAAAGLVEIPLAAQWRRAIPLHKARA